MIGLILALLYVAYQYAVSSVAVEQSFGPATHFLYWWYLLWSIPLALIVLVVSGLLTIGGGAMGAEGLGGKLGGMVGVAVGGAVSLPIVFFFVIRRGLYVGGAYILSTALTFNDTVPAWDTTRLALGGFMLLVVLITRHASFSPSRSSSSSS